MTASPTSDTSKALLMDASDFIRLENKIDEVANAVQSLILIEERQVNQKAELDTVKTRVEALGVEQGKINRRIDRMVNLVIGGWAVLVVLFELYKMVKGL